jgi:hypothetical protein
MAKGLDDYKPLKLFAIRKTFAKLEIYAPY